MEIFETSMNLFRSRIFAAFGLCGLVCLMGAIGYMNLEGYTLGEGLYMSAITMSTVGFGEVHPLSENGRLFTVGLILMSFISLAFAGHAVGESLLEKVWAGEAGLKKMKKKIAAFKNHYIICGYGRVGASAAACFEESGVDFVIIESDAARRAILAEKGFAFIEGDATHEELLAEAGIKRARGLLAMLKSDPDNLFIVLTAREMNPTLKIISRAEDPSSGHKIVRAGADDVVSPFTTAGTQIANEMLKASGLKSGDGASECTFGVPRWTDTAAHPGAMGRTISEWSDATGLFVIGLRRRGKDYIHPDSRTTLRKGDRLLLLQEEGSGAGRPPAPVETPRHRLVIVDDNPVITQLYTRLFQKAGFMPVSGASGKEGLRMILEHKPEAAVIDYLLPDMSGIEICREVRRSMDGHPIKVILFTADDSAATNENALAAGADAVVVKSPDSSEVIRTVIGFLEG